MAINPGTMNSRYDIQSPALARSTRVPIATPKMYIERVEETNGGKIVWVATERKRRISRFESDNVPIGFVIIVYTCHTS